MPSASLLVLGCPYMGLETLLPHYAQEKNYAWLGDLRLTAAINGRSLRDLYAHMQDAPPPDLLRALDQHYPSPAPAAERLSRFFSMRAEWSPMQFVGDLLQRCGGPALFLETEGCLRIDTLERWLALQPPLEVLHVVEPPEQFEAAAGATLNQRLFVAPDYRSHDGLHPSLQPLLAWYRIHHNIETFLQSEPRVRSSRTTIAQLRGQDEKKLSAFGAMNQRHPDIAQLAAHYGV